MDVRPASLNDWDFIDVEEAFLTIGTEEVFVLFFLLTLFCPTRVVLGRLGFLGFLNKKTNKKML